MHRSKRWLTLMAAGLCTAGAAGQAAAQDEPRAASRLDLGVYGGWSWTTPWLEVRDVDFGIGDNPVVGAFAGFFPAPRWGLRLHGAYIPSRYPTSENEALNDQLPIPEGRALNLWLYDLDLVFRPWAERRTALSGAYFFVGGGGVTTNPAGGNGECVSPYDRANACLSSEAHTVAQGTLGAGVTLVRLTRSLGIFAEGAAHFYESPFSIGADSFVPNPECPNECLADRGMAMTTRLVGGLSLGLGRRPPPVVPFVPLLPPPVVPPGLEAVRVCVHRDGFPQFVDAQIVPETGDTVVIQENGVRRPLRTVAPNRGTSVTSRPWHIRGENVFYGGREYVAFGLPALMQPDALAPRGEYDGVSLYTARGGGNAPGSTTAPAELFLPLYPECTFQRYVPREIPVRG